MAAMAAATPQSLLSLSSLADLADLLQSKEHLFALDAGDQQLSTSALDVAKGLFDLGLSLESTSHPHLHPLLSSLASQDAIATTRASALRKTKRPARDPTPPPPVDPLTILPYTPAAGLFVDGMSHDQVWKQLEMRSGGLSGVFKVLGEDEVEEQDEEQEMESEDSSDDDDDDEEEEGRSEDDEQEMLQQMIDEGMSIEQIEEAMEEYRVAKEKLAEDDSELDDEEDEDEDEDEDMEDDEDDEDDDELMDEEDINMDEDEDESLDPLFAGRGKNSHPTLDDDFFSIDAFNRITEEAEATKMSSGRLGDEDEEEEEEEEDLAGLMTGGGGALDDDEDLMYGDFFAPPPRDRTQPRKPNPSKSSKGKGKGKEKASVSFADQDEEKTSKGSGNLAEYGRNTMTRVRGDLFADDEDEDPEARLSNHEKRQLALQEQIQSLEQENVGPKDWTLLGEATARARPENSLLEEDLEYEHAGKVVPVITEERVATLEEVIKRRILDNNFDDIVRRRELDDKAFLPSRFFELQDQQSSRSLAQIYEDEFTAAQTTASGGKVIDPRDAKLQKEHEEIDKLWGDISYTLDALSNLNYTPKQPKTAITTISNVASTTLESALPTTQSTSTMLAPEEVFAPPSSSSLVARTELDPEEKRKARAKARKQKMHMQQGLDAAVDKYAGKGGGGGKARGGVRAEKDRALAELVKTGKGVTVIGKDSTKKRGGKAADASTVQASKLKL